MSSDNKEVEIKEEETNLLIPFPSDYDEKLKVSSLDPSTEIPIVQTNSNDYAQISIADALSSLPNLIHSNTTPDGVGTIRFSRDAVRKLRHSVSLYANIEDARAYIKAIPYTIEILKSSLLLEEHRDRKKNESGKRRYYLSSDPSIDKVQRLYGAISIDEELYRAKTTIKVYQEDEGTGKHHGFEIVKLELVSPKTSNLNQSEVNLPPLTSSIPLAKLLKDVELSYEPNVNLPTQFYYKRKWNDGWINVVNPFRASMVLGTPGSGKSYAIINNFIKQQIEKGFAMYIYDYKFPDLSEIAYNHLRTHLEAYEIKPHFYVINLDDPTRTHRCNPINPLQMTDISDAYESAYTIMLNLNRTWIQKQGDFFVESPIILLAAIIWYLKIYKDGRYCTFPHAIEFLNQPYAKIFPILTAYDELSNYLSPFMDAWEGGAQDQLQGQIASAKIPLSRMISPALYWVMTGNDFTLDINNPQEPKVLVVGNNPDRQNIYSAALGLYNSRIVKLINKKHQLKSSVIIDELPTIYFRGLDNLIATARSNKVAVCLGFQDFSQLTRDYGDKESKVIQNTVGNVFSGQVVGDTAKTLSERFGKVLQQRQSISINRTDKSTSISTQLDSLIPASKISTLTQGTFVGAISDNFGEEIDQKVFHAKIIVDNAKVKEETARYEKIPIINDFGELDEERRAVKVQEAIEWNYKQVKKEVKQLVEDEIKRIESDPSLCHLLSTAEE